MPGSVRNAVSVGVLPFSLCRQLVESRQWPVRAVEYHGGETERAALTSTSRRSWTMGKRLTPSALATLRALLDSYPVDAFYIYSMKETSPVFTWDATGVATAGRYLVRAAGDWNQTTYLARSDVQVQFIEVA
jgi:hypothetical protein